MRHEGESPVERLGPEDVPEVIDVLREAFFEYPVMRFGLGDPPDYSEQLGELISLFVAARIHRDEILLGIRDPQGLAATAMISFPDGRESPPALAEIRNRVWDRLGSEARARYESFGAAVGPLDLAEPHIHLNMIGVRERCRGMGMGRQLLDAAHEVSRLDPHSTGVTLSTEVPENVDLYRHCGYEVIGAVEINGAFTSWMMFRPDSPDER